MFDQLHQLAITLLNWVQSELPDDIKDHLSMPLPDMLKNSEHTLMRVIHYPPLDDKAPEGAIRAAEHEDINLLTILPGSNSSGLQIKNTQGEWIDAPADKKIILINTGDMIGECTNH